MEEGVWLPKPKFRVMACDDDVREMAGVIGQYDTPGKYSGWWGRFSVRLKPQMDRESRGYGKIFSNDLCTAHPRGLQIFGRLVSRTRAVSGTAVIDGLWIEISEKKP